MLTYLLAVLAACANATSSVLQRKANRKVPKKQNLSPGLIWSLAHQPSGGRTAGVRWYARLTAIRANLAVAGVGRPDGQPPRRNAGAGISTACRGPATEGRGRCAGGRGVSKRPAGV